MSVPTPQQVDNALLSHPLVAADFARSGPGGWSVTITPRTLWLAMGIAVLAAGLWIVISKGIYVLILLFTAIILAEGLRPIMNVLHKRLRLPQFVAVLLMYLGILLVFCVLIWLLLQAFVPQISTFTATLPHLNNQLGRLLQDVQHLLGNSPQIADAVTRLGDQGGVVAQSALTTLATVPQMLSGVIFGAVVVGVMAFFWLTGIAALRPFVLSLLPAESQPLVNDVLTDISRRLGGYLRGVVINMVVIGVLSTLGAWVLGAPFPLLLGVIAGLTQVIPYFGPWMSAVVAVIIVLPLAGPLKAAEVIGFYIVLQTIEGNTLTPIIMMDTVAINPLLSIVAVLLGSELLGVAGAVLGVPAVAILQVIVVRVLAPIAYCAAANASRSTPQPLSDRVGVSQSP